MRRYLNRSKFNVGTSPKAIRDRTYNGVLFASVLERRFYTDYILPKMEAGEIIECERQVSYILQDKYTHNGKTVHAIVYVADFVVTFSNGSKRVIDTKGLPDNVAKIKRKLFWKAYPDVDYVWMSYSKMDGGWLDYDDIEKCKRQRRKSKKREDNE